MKKIYSISYDLRRPGQNYTALYDAIKSLDTSCQHPLESTWYIRSSFSAQEIYDALRPNIDNGDFLMIQAVNVHNKQGWMPKTFWAWMNEGI